TDKHRLLTVVTAAAFYTQLMAIASAYDLKVGVPLRKHAKVGWVRFYRSKDGGGIFFFDNLNATRENPLPQVWIEEMEVNVQVAPGVLFGDGCQVLKGRPVLPTLKRMANETLRVLEWFERLTRS